MPLSTGQILSQRYRIVSLLGQGGMGAVYRAWDTSLSKPVAIKENLDHSPEAQRQFSHEARILGNLSHPNLPRVTDYFFLPGQGQYLVMDFVDGEDLQQILDRQQSAGLQPPSKGIPESQALEWIAQVCDALTYLHSQTPPIIHRDIKPANIKIRPDGKAMLVDFGIAKVYDPQLATTVGAKAVTPGYSPPEQYGFGATDSRSDLYALGATLYHLLTGQIPAESVQRTVDEASYTQPRRLNPNISPATEQTILRAMAISTQRRFQNAAEMRAALHSTSSSLATTVSFPAAARASTSTTATLPHSQPTHPAQPKPWTATTAQPATTRGKSSSAWLIILGVSAVIGIAGIYLATRRRPAEPTQEPLVEAPVIVEATTAVPPVQEITPSEPPLPQDNAPVIALTQTAQWFLSDSDGDGLDNSMETGMGTDPYSQDSDSDGVNDSSDPAPLQSDADNDGLSDGEEIRRGTQPTSPDSDQDGLGDGQEIGLGSNPLNRDTDNDKLEDGQELQIGTGLLNPDTDNDGFLDGRDPEPLTAARPPTPTFTSPPPPQNPPSPGDTKISPRDNMVMVWIGSFWMDQTEITNGMYSQCVQAGACTVPLDNAAKNITNYYGNSSYDNYPVVKIDFSAASKYCSWVGRQLPSQQQWQAAARGADNRAYSVGSQANCSNANIDLCFGDPTAAGRFPPGAFGIYDLTGNVYEWTTTPQGSGYVVMGGSWNDPASDARNDAIVYRTPDSQSSKLGFRCISLK